MYDFIFCLLWLVSNNQDQKDVLLDRFMPCPSTHTYRIGSYYYYSSMNYVTLIILKSIVQDQRQKKKEPI